MSQENVRHYLTVYYNGLGYRAIRGEGAKADLPHGAVESFTTVSKEGQTKGQLNKEARIAARELGIVFVRLLDDLN